MVTETPEVERALDLAAKRWPGEPRPRLVLRLIEQGAAQLEETNAAVLARRRAAVLSGAELVPSGTYPPNARQELLDEWPD